MYISPVTRRRFIGTSTLFGAAIVSERTFAIDGPEGENAHFHYRLAPAHPYVDSQRGNQAFGFGKGRIFLSEDNAKTWPHSTAFPDTNNITFSCILKNGNILFATLNKLFLSTDRLKTYREIEAKNLDGSDYQPHAPSNPKQPGWYFHPLDGVHTWDVDGKEMLVWGNYCNVLGGPVPVNIYYSTDQGETVKLAYAFGQNPRFQEKNAKTLLGNPDNSVICRHIHSVAYNPSERAFYACTGDRDVQDRQECHWLKGVYDSKNDKWSWKVLMSTNNNSRYKSGGINFVDGVLYWASDANGRVPPGQRNHDRGIFRCRPEDLLDKSKHEMLFNPLFESANLIIEDQTILSAHCAPASPYSTGFIISNDHGKTWTQYDLRQFGKRTPSRFQKKNDDGWFRVDLRKGWIERGEVLFIKPKV